MSSITDPIGDMLVRIRNAAKAVKDEVAIPASKPKARLAEILKREGYIADFTMVPDRLQGLLVIKLRYNEDGQSVIRGMRRQSRPGCRRYVPSDKLPKIRNGLGTAIISTSRGVLTDREARKAKVGGEFICAIW
jgi:small subunit ribosomal protein S8